MMIIIIIIIINSLPPERYLKKNLIGQLRFTTQH